jgi:hypothetical protein
MNFKYQCCFNSKNLDLKIILEFCFNILEVDEHIFHLVSLDG